VLDPGMQVDVITDYRTFARLDGEWNAAVARARIPYPFLRHEWVRTWWEAFGGRARLHVMLVRKAGRITAIAPFMRDTTVQYGVPVRRVRFIANDHTPRTDVIVVDDAVEAYRAIWDELRADRARWDVIQLGNVEHRSETLRIVRGLAAADRCPIGVWKSSDSPYLTLEGTWDDYLKALPAKFRSNLRNRLSRLTRLGEPALEVLDHRTAIESACADAWRLESSGWKQEAETAIVSDPAVRRFYTALIERGAAAGWLQLLFLTVGGRRIATSYGAVFDRRLMLFKTGYDPEYAPCAPFKLLTYLAVQHAYAQGLVEIDFLGDAEPWKLEWTSEAREHDWLFVFANTPRARLLHSVKFQLLPMVKRWRA
jgi:CelD/BcsL family acetyltransferase involved in cellulose biosynthesis